MNIKTMHNFISIVLLLSAYLLSGCVSKIVKHNKVSNDTTNTDIAPVVPFVETQPSTFEASKPSDETYILTNNIMLGIAGIILLICLAPVFLTWIDYTIEIVRDKFSKFNDMNK